MQLHGPLARYVKLRVAHAPGIPGFFSHHLLQRKPLVSDPGMHHGTCVMHVPWCMSGSLTRGGGENDLLLMHCSRVSFTSSHIVDVFSPRLYPIRSLSISHEAGPWYDIKMSSYQYMKFHCGDETVVGSSHIHNGISYTARWYFNFESHLGFSDGIVFDVTGPTVSIMWGAVVAFRWSCNIFIFYDMFPLSYIVHAGS